MYVSCLCGMCMWYVYVVGMCVVRECLLYMCEWMWEGVCACRSGICMGVCACMMCVRVCLCVCVWCMCGICMCL